MSIALRITGVAAATGLIYFFRGVLAPLCMALLISVVIHWIADSITKLIPNAKSWLITITTGLLAAATVLFGFGVISAGIARVLPMTDRIADRLQELIQSIGADIGAAGPMARLDIRSLIDQANVAALVQTAFQQMANGVSTVALTLVFVAFLLPSRPKLSAKFVSLAHTSQDAAEVRRILRQVVQGVRRTVLVQVQAAGITAALSSVVMWAVGMPDVLFWTIIVFMIAYVPVVGGTIAALMVAAFALIELPTFQQAGIVFLAIQGFYLLVGSIFVPRMQSSGANVDPVMGLVAVAAWTLLWGIPGALLANAITVLMMVLFGEFESTRWVAVLLSNDGGRRPAASD